MIEQALLFLEQTYCLHAATACALYFGRDLKTELRNEGLDWKEFRDLFIDFDNEEEENEAYFWKELTKEAKKLWTIKREDFEKQGEVYQPLDIHKVNRKLKKIIVDRFSCHYQSEGFKGIVKSIRQGNNDGLHRIISRIDLYGKWL